MTDQIASEQKPDASLFHADEREGEYELRFKVEGYVTRTIKAQSLEDARAQGRLLADDENEVFELISDEVEMVDLQRVSKTRKMYFVTRDGQQMQVSALRPGDEPREPTEHGF